MPRFPVPVLLLAAGLLAGCGTVSERGGGKVDVFCGGPFADMGDCMARAQTYCHGRSVNVQHDYSKDTPPERRLLFSCH